MAKKTVMQAERACFLDRKGEESEAGVRVRFPRWGNLTCFQDTYLIRRYLWNQDISTSKSKRE